MSNIFLNWVFGHPGGTRGTPGGTRGIPWVPHGYPGGSRHTIGASGPNGVPGDLGSPGVSGIRGTPEGCPYWGPRRYTPLGSPDVHLGPTAPSALWGPREPWGSRGIPETPWGSQGHWGLRPQWGPWGSRKIPGVPRGTPPMGTPEGSPSLGTWGPRTLLGSPDHRGPLGSPDGPWGPQATWGLRPQDSLWGPQGNPGVPGRYLGYPGTMGPPAPGVPGASQGHPGGMPLWGSRVIPWSLRLHGVSGSVMGPTAPLPSIGDPGGMPYYGHPGGMPYYGHPGGMPNSVHPAGAHNMCKCASHTCKNIRALITICRFWRMPWGYPITFLK